MRAVFSSTFDNIVEEKTARIQQYKNAVAAMIAQLFLLLGDHRGDGILVLLNAGGLLFHDVVERGLDHVGVLAELLAGAVDAAREQVSEGPEVASNGFEHVGSPV